MLCVGLVVCAICASIMCAGAGCVCVLDEHLCKWCGLVDVVKEPPPSPYVGLCEGREARAMSRSRGLNLGKESLNIIKMEHQISKKRSLGEAKGVSKKQGNSAKISSF